jgi:hypothetical protein
MLVHHSNSFLQAVSASVAPEDVYQIDLQDSLDAGGAVKFLPPGAPSSSSSSSSSSSKSTQSSSRAMDFGRVCGRGDGSLLSTKFTGVAIYLHERFESEVRVLAVTKFAFSSVTSKGGAAVALSLAGRTVVFISCHLEAHHNKVELRREQYRALMTQLGSSLAEEGFHLNEQFHHIVWVGDMNYRLCSTAPNTRAYQEMSSDTALQMLESYQKRVLFDKHDQFNIEKQRREIFYGYRVADPFPNFYPSYKKIENRPPVNFR